MAKKKENKLPYDKANDIKPLVAYFAIVNQGNADAIVEIFKKAGSSLQLVQMGHGTANKQIRDILGIEDNQKEIKVYNNRNKRPLESKQTKSSSYLKGKSTLIIFERHANLKYKYGNRSFWCRGFYASTVGNNKSAVYNYVQNQLKEDMMTDQVTIKEYKDPFKG